MEPDAGLRISRRAFIQTIVILLLLMLAGGLLSYVIPAGAFDRVEQDGRLTIAPDSFRYTPRPDYPAWRWLTAPLEVLVGPNGLTVIVIIVFLLLIGMAFSVLASTGLLAAGLASIVRRFGRRKYTLLWVISLFFMSIGAFLGIFEEVVPLVPLALALSYSLGWDALVGLGMSILAVNMGFSAAITNPFTLGVAQRLSGLPLFSGAWLRVLIFLCIYFIFIAFLIHYARRVERRPQTSPIFAEDTAGRARYGDFDLARQAAGPGLTRAARWLAACLALILVVLMGSPFIPALSDYSLPLIGLLFFIGGVGAGLVYGAPRRQVGRAMLSGLVGIAPAIPLILMAASVGHIVAQGGVLDTLIYLAGGLFAGLGPFPAALAIYAVALVLELLIASGSAKAFLLMPILVPLADLSNVTRQTMVTAYCFGDGFSNLIYPTNAVLLICLGLSAVSYGKWLRWTLPLWFWVVLVTVLFLGIASIIGYGPF
jgi:uncharacterized ion transporter superfamily protein YfcC